MTRGIWLNFPKEAFTWLERHLRDLHDVESSKDRI